MADSMESWQDDWGAPLGALKDQYLGLLDPPGLQTDAQFSTPFLISATDGWTSSAYRVMIVGQETFGWDYSNDDVVGEPIAYLRDCQPSTAHLKAALRQYRDFDFAEGTRFVSSPFWQAHRHFANTLESGNYRAVLWSNLIRISCYKGSGTMSAVWNLPESDLADLLEWQHGTLIAEIASFEVQAVVFVTGPSYDHCLLSEFPGAKFSPLPGLDAPVDHFAQIRHECLPSVAYRTYHPGYLRRSKKRWAWIDTICEGVTRGACIS